VGNGAGQLPQVVGSATALLSNRAQLVQDSALGGAMLDTVRAQVRCELDPDELLHRGFHQRVDRVQGAEGVVKEVVAYNLHLPGESPHYLAYLPPLRSDESGPAGCLTVETSLPKALRGENVTLLASDDVQACFDVVSNRISDRVGDVGDFGDFDVRGRVDAVFSWRTSHVDDYLHALKSMNLARHVSQSVDRDATVYWRNKQRVIRSYDKFKESGLEIAKNQLRFEVQMNHAKGDLDHFAGVTSTKIRDVVTWETAEKILGFFLTGLGADMVIADDAKLVKYLLKTCTAVRARRLLGAMIMQRIYSRDELVRRGVKRRTFYQDRSDIRKIGLSEGSAKTGVLPSLALPEQYTGEPMDLD